MRGNAPRNNLILVDDIPFARVVHFNNNFGELDEVENGGRYSVFAPNIVGSAEFQPGGWKAAYGGQAGSLLKLEVAEGNADSPTFNTRLDISGIEVGYDGPSYFHQETSILFSARQLNFGRVFELIDEDDFGEPKVTDIVFKSVSQLSDRDDVSVLMIYAPETFTRDADNALASDKDDPGNWEDLSLVETDIDTSLFAVNWSHLIGDTGELVNRFYWRDYAENVESGELLADQVPFGTAQQNIPQRFPLVTSQNDETEYGWRVDYSVDNPLGRAELGFRLVELELLLRRELSENWIRYEYNQNDFRPNPDQRFIVLTPETTNTEYRDSGLQSVIYADQEFALGPLDMRLGIRYESDGLLDDTAISPRLAANWQITDPLSATLTAGRYLQAPSFEDIAANPNNALSLQKTDQISVGFKYTISDEVDLFIEPYYQKFIDRVVEQDRVTQTFANTGEGFAYGVDTAITRSFENGWSANFTYSYNEARVKDQANGPEYDADFSRPHSASVGGVWEINARWKVSARIKYASGRPFDDFIINENVLGDGQALRFSKEAISNNTERYDGFFSVNARVDYRRSLGPADLVAFIDIINLTASENPNQQIFNERTGAVTIDEGSAFPLAGFRLEW